MNFNAFKMDGLGNDFLIIDNRKQKVYLNEKQIQKLLSRSLYLLKFLNGRHDHNMYPIGVVELLACFNDQYLQNEPSNVPRSGL